MSGIHVDPDKTGLIIADAAMLPGNCRLLSLLYPQISQELQRLLMPWRERMLS